MFSVGVLGIVMIIWLILLCVITQFLAYWKGLRLLKSHHSYTFIQDTLIKRYVPGTVLILFLISAGVWMFIFSDPPWYKAVPFQFIFLTVKKYITIPPKRPELIVVYNYMYIIITTLVSALILMVLNSAFASPVAKRFSKAKVFTGIIQSN